MDKQACEIDYQYLYHSASCGLVVFKVTGEILHVNQTFLTWTGITGKEDMPDNFNDYLDKGGKFYYQLFVQPLLKMHREVREISLTIQTATGNFPCLFSATVLKDVKGYDDIIHAAVYKIADRKKYETELLKKRVEAEAQKQIKIMALREVAFDQAHLVRAPLANILAIISLVEQMELTEELKEMVLMLSESGTQLDEQVTRIVNKTNR